MRQVHTHMCVRTHTQPLAPTSQTTTTIPTVIKEKTIFLRREIFCGKPGAEDAVEELLILTQPLPPMSAIMMRRSI